MRDWPELLSEISDLEAPADVTPYVMARISAAQSRPGSSPVRGGSSRRLRLSALPMGWLAAAVGCVLVLAVLAVAAHSRRDAAPRAAPTGTAACFPGSSPVSGGTAAQREIVANALCKMTALKTNPRVRIYPTPDVAPGGIGLDIVAHVPPQPASPTGPAAAQSTYADEQASWLAAVIAGAVRDQSRRQHLPHVVTYKLFYATGAGTPTFQSQGRIALPGWGDPEGQGSFPPATLGHGVPSDAQLQTRLDRVAAQTHTTFTLTVGDPLGKAPMVTITAKNPRRLLAGPIPRYISAVEFSQARYDGVLLAVNDTKGNPVWVATTAARIGNTGCTVLFAESGTNHGTSPSLNSAGARACAAAGIGLS